VFGFTEVAHKNYENNFLRSVVFQVSFDKNDQFVGKANQIKDLFKEDFPRFNVSKEQGIELSFNKGTSNVKSVNEGSIINLKSEDGQKSIQISDTRLNFTVSGKAYKCFSDLNSELVKIGEFLELCSIKNVVRLAIRKINIVEFKINDTPTDVLSFLLNSELVSYLNAFPNKEHINHSLQVLNYKDNNNYLNLKYGLVIPQNPNTTHGQLVIDIDMYKQESIKKEDIVSESKIINSEIFNIFSWLINDNTKKLLQDG